MKCCICGTDIKGFGNNPWPVIKDKKSRCCDRCNANQVIPKRIELMQKEKMQ